MPLISGIRASLETSLNGIENIVPEELLNKLKKDVFVFGGCKTVAELREASSLLIDDDGKVRTWNSFKTEMTKLHKLYNVTYLEAEYNFATQSSLEAANWIKDQEFAEDYDSQYRTAGDDSVRLVHEQLNGITLPNDDDFWLYYNPPNGWRCRCRRLLVIKGKYKTSDSKKSIALGEQATTQINKNGDNNLEMFRFNPGREEVVFPQSHPYYKLKGDLTSE